MNIFGKPFETVTFEDVEKFCTEKRLETAQLDYKRSMPREGLSKHIAAASNTLGSTIIVGVEEDTAGYPSKWEGIPVGKTVDQVYAQAANVKPYPSCHVYQTPPKNDKVFVIVSVLEGNAGPYYTVTDPSTVWIRTGNISTPLKPADQDATERIRNKRDKADETRRTNLAFADQMYKTLIENAQEERTALYKSDPVANKHLTEAIGKDVAQLELTLQPYYPLSDVLGVKPAELQSELMGLRGRHHHVHFPGLNARPAVNGSATIHNYVSAWTSLCCDQFYVSGLVYHSHDVRAINGAENPPSIYMSHLLMEIHEFLQVAQRLYAKFGYHGLLIGNIKLAGTRGLAIQPTVPSGYFPSFLSLGEHSADLDEYNWPLSLDTRLLNDKAWTLEYLMEQMEKINWDLGKYTHFDAEIEKLFLSQQGFIPAPAPVA